MLRIPLITGRSTSISTSILANDYIFDVQWNNRLGLYQMDIYENNNLVLGGMMLVSGTNIIEGLNGINLPNIHCIKVGFPYEEIGFSDLTTIGFIVVDDLGDIQTDEEYLASIENNTVIIPDETLFQQRNITGLLGEQIFMLNGERLITIGNYKE